MLKQKSSFFPGNITNVSDNSSGGGSGSAVGTDGNNTIKNKNDRFL
jgi:hypothetical protein